MTTLTAPADLLALTPDARMLRQHLDAPAFQRGADVGWWREDRWAFPLVDVAVAAVARPSAPAEYLFRFECVQYPTQAPLAQLWDRANESPLARALRPTGRDQVGLVFRVDWHAGQYLYTPFDRFALQEHPDWPVKHPRTAWQPHFTITHYLAELHALLASPAYTSMVGA